MLVAAVLSIATISSSCAGLDARLGRAAAVEGTARARVTLPPWPDDCRRLVPHAALAEGEQVVSVLKRERGQLDKANARTGRCAAHYDAVRRRLK